MDCVEHCSLYGAITKNLKSLKCDLKEVIKWKNHWSEQEYFRCSPRTQAQMGWRHIEVWFTVAWRSRRTNTGTSTWTIKSRNSLSIISSTT